MRRILLAILVVSILTMAVAASPSSWDFSEGVPVEYFLGTWVLQEPAPSVTIEIQEFLGSKDDEYGKRDYFKGVVILPDEAGAPRLVIDQIPGYVVNQNYAPEDQNPNVIELTRMGTWSFLYIRALVSDDSPSARFSLLSAMQGEYEDNRFQLRDTSMGYPDGRSFFETDVWLVRK